MFLDQVDIFIRIRLQQVREDDVADLSIKASQAASEAVSGAYEPLLTGLGVEFKGSRDLLTEGE